MERLSLLKDNHFQRFGIGWIVSDSYLWFWKRILISIGFVSSSKPWSVAWGLQYMLLFLLWLAVLASRALFKLVKLVFVQAVDQNTKYQQKQHWLIDLKAQGQCR